MPMLSRRSAAVVADFELSVTAETNESGIASEISDVNLSNSAVLQLYCCFPQDGADRRPQRLGEPALTPPLHAARLVGNRRLPECEHNIRDRSFLQQEPATKRFHDRSLRFGAAKHLLVACCIALILDQIAIAVRPPPIAT